VAAGPLRSCWGAVLAPRRKALPPRVSVLGQQGRPRGLGTPGMAAGARVARALARRPSPAAGARGGVCAPVPCSAGVQGLGQRSCSGSWGTQRSREGLGIAAVHRAAGSSAGAPTGRRLCLRACMLVLADSCSWSCAVCGAGDEGPFASRKSCWGTATGRRLEASCWRSGGGGGASALVNSLCHYRPRTVTWPGLRTARAERECARSWGAERNRSTGCCGLLCVGIMHFARGGV